MVYCRSWKRWSWPCWRSGHDCYQTCHFKWFFIWKLLWHEKIPFSSNTFLRNFQTKCQSNWRGKAEDSLKVYNTVDGSSAFQVAVSTPNSETFKAAPRLCLCDNCLSKYGSCKMFKTYSFIASNWKPTPYGPSIKLS